MKTVEHWICAMISLFSGGVAYLHIPDFLNSWPLLDIEAFKKIAEISWAVLVAGVTTITGLASKYWWDVRGKRIMARWFKKKRGSN